MNEYKSNSHKSKTEASAKVAEKKQVQKVIAGKAVAKTNHAGKLADVFAVGDMNNVANHVFMDILIPSLKKAIVDIVSDGINMMMWGETKKSSSSGTKISYSNYYNGNHNNYAKPAGQRPGYTRDDILFESRGDAQMVLNAMDEILEEYKIVSVADMYDAAGLSCDYTANKFGWTGLRGADIIRVRDGYIIKLPKAMPIDNM